MKEIRVGNLVGEPGKFVYGWYDVLEHPTGTTERLPIIIAQGFFEGPTLWLTANIHGDEYTGIPVIHKLLEQINIQELKGAIVAIPTLNPSGSRIANRYPYYDKKDPNRLFPDGNPFKDKPSEVHEKTLNVSDQKNSTNEQLEIVRLKSETQIEITINSEEVSNDPLAQYDKDEKFPSIQEIIFNNLFKEIKQSADILIDLHNAYIKSIPFIFLDRVLYNEEKGETVSEANSLFEKTYELAKAFGFTIIREATPKRYIQKKLHRSTSGAALNFLRIPSFTVELGMHLEVDEEIVVAAIIGIENIMKCANMMEGEIKKQLQIPNIAIDENIRYVGHPRMTQSGIIELKIKKGDFVKKGDIIAIAKDIFGRPLKEGSEIKTEIDGYIFMINEGILRYPNEEICWIASTDTIPMVDKWPK